MNKAQKKPNTIEKDLDMIRRAIREENKHLSPQEKIRKTNEQARELSKQYGFKIVTSVKK